jgi:hypothetical protein
LPESSPCGTAALSSRQHATVPGKFREGIIGMRVLSGNERPVGVEPRIKPLPS